MSYSVSSYKENGIIDDAISMSLEISHKSGPMLRVCIIGNQAFSIFNFRGPLIMEMVAIAGILGLMVGVLAAFLREGLRRPVE